MNWAIGRRNLAELAGSCEYFSTEKLCEMLTESEKARARRQVHCQNSENMTCCYVCSFRRDCDIKCRYLGNIENESSQTEADKSEVEPTVINGKKTEMNQTENAPVFFCSECNVEMSLARTKFRISGWEKGLPLKPAEGDSGKLGDEILPVIVYLCPKCGKMEFRADEK